jgi:hypothetical protein
MSRQVYLLGLGLVLVAGAFLVTDSLVGRQPGVTEANVRRVRPGMTFSQVEGILGEWTEELQFYPPAICLVVRRNPSPPAFEVWKWRGEDGVAEVRFAPSGRVLSASFEKTAQEASGPKPDGPLDRLRSWLGW